MVLIIHTELADAVVVVLCGPTRGYTLLSNAGTLEILDALLDELDAQAEEFERAHASQPGWECRRRAPRYPFRANCTIRLLLPSSWKVSVLAGRTRNMSQAGASFIARREFAEGEAAELEISTSRRPRMFLAGLVTSCRYANHGYYEIGISLKSAQAEPVFSVNPRIAVQRMRWLSEGLRLSDTDV